MRIRINGTLYSSIREGFFATLGAGETEFQFKRFRKRIRSAADGHVLFGGGVTGWERWDCQLVTTKLKLKVFKK